MKTKNNSKQLLKKIKSIMQQDKMRWRDISDFFGFESQSTVHAWFSKDEIPKNWQHMVTVILETRRKKK